MNIEITIKEGVSLQEQTQVFQAWFNENILPKVTFGNGIDSEQTCTEFDQFNRPSVWEFEEVKVVAEYFSEDINYRFNKFLIYGRYI